MKNRVVLIKVDKLKGHEKTNLRRLRSLMVEIVSDGCLKRPVVVDRKTLVILDGHHRHKVFKMLGLRKIPVFFVDYLGNNKVRVYLRRKELMVELIKEAVLKRALKGRLFPEKTTRHLIKNRPAKINYSLKKLMKKG